MTRENKIALVIGFAIMLVIGVLLSDHLAQTVRGRAADLSAIDDPLQAPPGDRIEFLPLVGQSPDPSADVEDPQDGSDAAVPAPAAGPPMHVVGAGETLSAIARLHYGEPMLAPALAAHNRLPAPDRLALGLRLLIPPRDVLEAGASTGESPPEPASTLASYTVRSGDTLSQLAQKLMGTAKATDELWSLNRPTLSHPDALRVGMTLRYPRPASP